MQWDLYCRVVDNFGDIGVAWRLAADLAARGEQVRLATDDARPLAWLAPEGAAGGPTHRGAGSHRGTESRTERLATVTTGTSAGGTELGSRR